MHIRVRHTIVWIALGAVTALAFAAYFQPQFVADLAGRIWMCFQ